jgi:hypothetical protein
LHGIRPSRFAGGSFEHRIRLRENSEIASRANMFGAFKVSMQNNLIAEIQKS